MSFVCLYSYTYIQCSGEAEFTTDISTMNGELAAAFVLTTQVYRKYHSILKAWPNIHACTS